MATDVPAATTTPPAPANRLHNGLVVLMAVATGAVVANLYAETNATLSGKDSATVAVIDNATGATLLSCTVERPKNSCSSTGPSLPVAAGHRIEVKVTATGSSANYKAWQVSFRY